MEMWQLQEAKNKFSQVVNLAGMGRPQYITRHGKPVAVLSSIEDFEAGGIKRAAMKGPTLVEFLMGMQLPDTLYEHGQEPFPRIKGGQMRDVDLSDW